MDDPDAGVQVVRNEGNINSIFAEINELKEQLKLENEMLNSYLNGSPEYVAAAKSATAASKEKSGIKNKLIQAPAGAEVANKVTQLKERLKMLGDTLSEALQVYQKATGQNSFEAEDGEVRQIVFIAKLVKRNQFQK